MISYGLLLSISQTITINWCDNYPCPQKVPLFFVTLLFSIVLTSLRTQIGTSIILFISSMIFTALFFEDYSYHPKFLSTCLIFFVATTWYAKQYVVTMQLYLANQTEIKIRENAQTLLRLVTHDLSNTNQTISLILNSNVILKNPETSIPIAKKMANRQKEIIESVKYIAIHDIEDNDINLEWVSAVFLVAELEEVFSDQLKKKNIELKFDIRVSETEGVIVNKVLFVNSVLGNILSNAIKFSEENSTIEITVEKIREHISFKIRDFGTGIDENHLKELSENKINKSQHGTKGEAGSGFGLFLVYKYVKKFGGDIKIKSKTDGESKGTEVSITI